MRVFSQLAQSDIHLEAECADHRVSQFIQDYQRITGIRLRRGHGGFHIIRGADGGKYGLEGRVYFNATSAQVNRLRRLGIRVQGPRTRGYLADEYSYRVDRNRLFWALISAGHRI
jgi:hypothetical protein